MIRLQWSCDTHSTKAISCSLGCLAESGLIFSVQLNLDMPVSACLTNSSVPRQADLTELSVTCMVFLF